MNTATTTSPSADSPATGKRKVGKVITIIAGIIITISCAAIVKVTLLPPAPGFDGYNYSSYRQNVADSPGPQPGDKIPGDFEIFDLNGNTLKLNTLWKDKPLVLEFGSVSCPIFHGNGPSMDDLYDKYDKGVSEKARVGLLYVREAHPGWFRKHHEKQRDKIENAHKLKDKGLQRTIWADSVTGELHQYLEPGPNSVYVINTDGKILYKSVWVEPKELDRVLNALTNENRDPDPGESNHCHDPSKYYRTRDMLAYMGRIVTVGGPDAFADFLINEQFADNDGDATDEEQCSVEL